MLPTRQNLLLLTDSYKPTHWLQYPAGTTRVHSYLSSRGGVYPAVLPFAFQYYLYEYLARPIIEADLDEAYEFFKAHFGNAKLFNNDGWQHIIDTHKGMLPVSIRAVPEGLLVPTHNVLMTVENTDPVVPWLTNYLETLLVQVWYGTTVATQSYYIKQLILKYLNKTGDPAGISFKLHDFGFRGVSSVESAAVGGAAHLVNFMGSDTIPGLVLARDYYNEPMAGFSIPAAEHSTITSWGEEHEVDAFRNMIKQFGGGSLYAVVSDSYDIYRACSELWGKALKEEVLAAPATLVVRPDSGVPHEVVLEVLERLGASSAFGFTVNAKGYKVLNKVRVIQGDGIDHQEIEKILSTMEQNGWSADNIAFGMGGALLQKLHRDTQRFAFKCSAIEINGEWRSVQKRPVTDPSKASLAGRLRLVKQNGEFRTVPDNIWIAEQDILKEIFRDGKILVNHTFAEIRARANA